MLNRKLRRGTVLVAAVSLPLAACDRNMPTSVESGVLPSAAVATRASGEGSALISVDDAVFGPGAVTRDVVTGLEWLDLTFSTNRSFEEMTGVTGPSPLEPGGEFAGWRYATVSEIRSLFLDAGIPDVPGFSPANREPVAALMALVGVTCVAECSNIPASIGISADADPANPPFQFMPNLQDWTSFGRVDFTLLLGPDTRGPAWGSWLVRPAAIVVDDTPPETQILSADAGGVVMMNDGMTLSHSLTLTFSGSDDAGVAAFECRVDEASYTPCTSPATYADLSIGSHVFEVRAVDAAGNIDLSPARIAWEIITASVATENLITAIQDMGLGRGVANSLTAPLQIGRAHV